jgi:type II secretory pathway component PulF
MPSYKFEAMDATGMEIRDEVDAENQEAAMAQIRQMGYFVTKINPKDRKPLLVRAKKVSPLITFAGRVSLLRLAGVLTLGWAFTMLIGYADWRAFVEIMTLTFAMWTYSYHIDK